MGFRAALRAWLSSSSLLAALGCNAILGVDGEYVVGPIGTTSTGSPTGTATGSAGSGGEAGGAGGSAGSAGSTPADYALEFDGDDDYVITPRPLAGELTIEAWVRTSEAGAGAVCYLAVPLVYADQTGNLADFSTCLLEGGRLGFSIGREGQTDVVLASADAINTGAWVHVAASKGNMGRMRVYVDGSPNGQLDAAPTTPVAGPEEILFGGNQIDQRYYRGRLREVRLWNVVRTAAEIGNDYDRRLTGDEPGLIGYWPLDEGTGTTGHDRTASGNDATLGGGNPNATPTWVTDSPPLR